MKIIFTLLPFFYFINSYSQPKNPVLRIETGMHIAAGKRISTDAAGRYLLTCGNDKTARLWDAGTGALLNTLRVPVGRTEEGKLYACALSVDGRIAAVGGWTGDEWDNNMSVYLINVQTGVIIHRIKGLTDVIFDLEFSPDGKWLAVGLGAGYGVRIYDTGGWGEYKSLGGYAAGVYSISFNDYGGLAVASFDGKIRVYNSEFEMTAEKGDLSGKEVYTVVFNRTGTLLALGFEDSPEIEVRDATDLSLLFKPSVSESAEKNGGLSVLSFSYDGTKLYGAGSFKKAGKDGYWHRGVRCWSNSGKGGYQDMYIMKSSILDMKPLKNGSLAVIGIYPDIAVIDPSNKVTWYHSAGTNDYGALDLSHFRINGSGSSIGFTPFNELPYSFEILQRTLQQQESLFPKQVDINAGTKITNYNSANYPEINGNKVNFLDQYESSRCADISSNGKQIVIGGDWFLYLSDNKAEKKWKIPLPGSAWAVNISGNDKLVAAALGDGTIRWYSLDDGKELLAFFLHADKKRWVMFTPSGYYDASAGAEDFLGWHINNGSDNAPVFYPVSRFKEKFYRPDIIDAVFETYEEEKAIELANKRSNKNQPDEVNIRKKLPPTLIISSPFSGSTISNNTVSIQYSINSPEDAPAKNIRVLVDGRPVATERGFKPVANTIHKITVDVPSRDCIITLLAENENGISPESNLYLKWAAPAITREEFIYKPKLYVLAIGVSDYNSTDLKLGFAAKDASDFSTAINKQKGNLYNDVIIKKLTNKEATKDAILDGFDWIQKETGQKDVAMIFYAGHGINDNNGVFYMLPVAADLERIRATCLNFEELKQTVSSIAGKVVVFIDACHSGNVMGVRRGGGDINALVNELSSTENGAITFTSSTGKEFSLEDPAWANGAFTKAVIEGLNGKAVIGGNNKITIKSLDAYISERVKEITKGKQHPTSVTPPNVPDFPIAIFK